MNKSTQIIPNRLAVIVFMSKQILIIGVLFINTLFPDAFAQDNQNSITSKIAKSRAWLNLMYYKEDGDKFKSLVVSEHYFVDKIDGKTNPLKELKANIKLFQESTIQGDRNYQCHFPARYKFLKKHFKLAAPVECGKLNTWKKTYRPNKMQLVYTSQYLSNPASFFGHLFLLLPSDELAESFWMTINYAANTSPDVGTFSYIYGGLTGWHTGDFMTKPYYRQLFEYTNIEDRNLWKYDIKLTASELDFYIDHIWELIHRTQFQYYFMDENCAGLILRTLNNIIPDLNIEDELPIFVHPVEVVQRLNEVNRLSEPEFVPSSYGRVSNLVNKMNNQEKNLFYQALDIKAESEKEIKALLSTISSVLVLEALTEYIHYVRIRNSDEIPEDLKNFEKVILLQRAKKPILKNRKAIPTKFQTPPTNSHKSQMLSFGGGEIKSKGRLNLGMRFVGHSIIDPSIGFNKNMELEIGTLEISGRDDQFWIKEFKFITAANYIPAFEVMFRPSWDASLILKENIITESLTDQYLTANGSFGISESIFNIIEFYALSTLALNSGTDGVRGEIEIGPKLGLIVDLEVFKFNVFGKFSEPLVKYKFDKKFQRYWEVSGQIRQNIYQDLTLIISTDWIKRYKDDFDVIKWNFETRYTF